jgi:peptidoglycan/LPS O-acetylase OafA/YrhL
MERRETIESLTGLRFVAAFCVMFAHLLPKAMPIRNPPGWYQQISSVSAEGMTLFFVLSGFVIHYNYAASIERDGARGIANFFVARFARLYPLYIVVIAGTLVMSFAYSQIAAATPVVLPSYLLMVQTWFYWPVGQFGLIHELGLLPTIAWSISTEWFFYVAYPLIWIGLSSMEGVRAKLWVALLMSALISTAIVVASLNIDALNEFGARTFGVVGEASTEAQYSFYRWLVYFSPYSRIFEFMLGCICSSIYMGMRTKKASEGEQRIGLAVLVATIIATALLHWVMFGPANGTTRWSIITQFHMAYGFAPFMAIIIFCCARYQNAITRALSSWPMVACGEASYSLYLLHLLIVMAVRWEAAEVTSFKVGVGDALRLTVAALAAIGLSLVTWRIIEVPARRIIRDALTIPAKQIA